MRQTALLLSALAGASYAQVAHMMRFACSQLTVERLDRKYRVAHRVTRGAKHHDDSTGESWTDWYSPYASDSVRTAVTSRKRMLS